MAPGNASACGWLGELDVKVNPLHNSVWHTKSKKMLHPISKETFKSEINLNFILKCNFHL